MDVNISKILTFTILVTCYYNLSMFYIYVYSILIYLVGLLVRGFFETNAEIHFCSVTSESSHRAWKLLKDAHFAKWDIEK